MTSTILTQAEGTGFSSLTCWQHFWLIKEEVSLDSVKFLEPDSSNVS